MWCAGGSEQTGCDAGPEHGPAGADGGGDLVAGGALQDVAAGAGAQCRDDCVIVVEHRHDEHRGRIGQSGDARGRLDTGKRGQAEIHQDDVDVAGLG